MIALLNVLAYLPRRPLAPSPQVTYRPVVVLLHGTNSTPRVFRRLSLALARRGIAFVAPSYGKHGSAPVTECVDELVETVAGYKEIDIVGHSFGGLVAVEVARGLRIDAGRVTASVEGTQLEPFDVILTTRTVDTPTLANLLRERNAVDELMLLTRGEQPPALGELLVPTESADVETDCTCPDEAPRCIHALVTCYEVAAEIDRTPLTLLTVMGTDLRALLAEIDSRPPVSRTADDAQSAESLQVDDYYGTASTLPPLPSPSRMNPLTALDGGELRAALRATGVAPADIAEAIDELGDLYDRLTAGDS